MCLDQFWNLTRYVHLRIVLTPKSVYKSQLVIDKRKAGESQRRKATGPRFLRDAFCDATKDPRSPGCRIASETYDLRKYCESDEPDPKL